MNRPSLTEVKDRLFGIERAQGRIAQWLVIAAAHVAHVIQLISTPRWRQNRATSQSNVRIRFIGEDFSQIKVNCALIIDQMGPQGDEVLRSGTARASGGCRGPRAMPLKAL